MRYLLIILSITLLTINVQSQSYRVHIKGTIIDKDTRSHLIKSTIYCTLIKDSTKVIQEYSDKNGDFKLDVSAPDNYMLKITFIGYKPSLHFLKISIGDSIINLGEISLEKVGYLLSTVEIIQERKPVRIAKDTLEYDAGFFRMKENALVEDLIKKLPGIRIDKNGNVIINGEITKTILINGKSLFDDSNPQILLKNLQSDLVDKIQIIDRTPINNTSNQPEKIINITIKKDKLGTTSGELSIGYGLSNKFTFKESIGNFKEKQQLLIVSNGDNTNGASDSQIFAPNGLQEKWAGGISLGKEISKKISINLNSTLNKNATIEEKITTRKSMIADSFLYYNQHLTNRTNQRNASISFKLEYKIDSSQTLTISNQLTSSKNITAAINSYETTLPGMDKLNEGSAETVNNNTITAFTNELEYEKKYSPKGRNLKILFSMNNSKGPSDGYNSIKTLLYHIPGQKTNDSLDQYRPEKNSLRQLFLIAQYSEPITKYSSISFSIGENLLLENARKSVFDYDNVTREYTRFNDSLSTIFKTNQNQHSARIAWSHQKKKLDYTLSLSLLLYKMESKDANTKLEVSQNIVTLLPSANFGITFKEGKKIRFIYNKTTEFPSLYQLQPIPDNKDPLYTKKGNINLKPKNEQTLNVSYNALDMTTLRSQYISFNSRFLLREIVDAISIDSVGRQIIEPQNINGTYTLDLNIENGFPIRNSKNFLYIRSNLTLKKIPNYINDAKGTTKEFSFEQAIRLNVARKNYYEYSISTSIDYNRLNYLNKASSISSFISGNVLLSVDLNFPFNIHFMPDVSWNWSTGRIQGYNNNPILLNATISKKMLPHQQAVIQLQAFDLLRKSSNIVRSVGQNYIEDTQSNTLERFFILKFSYFLGKKHP